MKVLIIGKTSNLSKHIYDKFINNSKLNVLSISSKIDFDYIKNFYKLVNLINKFKPKYVLNLAAINKQSQCERDPKLAYEVNAFFPYKLSILCKKNKIYFFHFSSDAVFSGTENKLYEVRDSPVPNSIYGKSKLCGDYLVLNYSNSIIIRLPMVYGKYFASGYVYDCIKNMKLNKKIHIVKDIYCSPINASDVANYLLENIFQKNKLNYLLNKKLIHLSNNKRISRYSFIKKISNLINKSRYVFEISFNDLKLKYPPVKYRGLRSNVKSFKCSTLKDFINE